MAKARLTINYQGSVMALTEPPQLGWQIESEKRDVRQTAYRLMLAEDADFREPLFDSGRVETEESQHIVPPIELPSAARLFVRAEVSLNTGELLTAEGSFLTGERHFHAAFIASEGADEAAHSRGNYVRKEFTIGKRVRAAYLFTTALGLYEAYLNGERVGDEAISPGWTAYQKRLLYQTHDVTAFLHEGANAIGAHVGAGWYKGEMGFIHDRNYYGTQTAFFAELKVVYEDGTEERVVTDETWRRSASPVLFSEIYDGETYDARREQEDWSEAGFDAAAWEPCERVDYPLANLVAQVAAPVREHESFTPKIFTTPRGELCLDFGQNMAGRVHIKARGKAGECIRLHFFEVLGRDGNAYFANLRRAKETISYTFGADGEASYYPHFTYQGFRYAVIEEFPGTPAPECFTARALYSDIEEAGDFSCSHELLTQFHKNVGWSLRSNFVDIPTDCPQRDERLGWTGDAQIFSATACYHRGAYEFYKKWLADLAADQTADGGVPHVVPDIITGHEHGDWLLSQGTHSAAAWADAAVLIPWHLYRQYGDTAIIRRQYRSMKAWIDFMHAHAEGNIWNYKLQFGDWVALDAEPGSYYGATPNDLTCTAYYALSTGLFAKMAGLIGEAEDAAKYQALHESIAATFRETFFDEEGNLKVQTQTSHIVALVFGLAAPEYREKVAVRLRELLDKENGHLVTGFVGTPYFCEALSESGMTEEAYALLLQEDFPSWLYQVKMGATTTWEHWDGLKPDGSMWSPDMNSFNHYAYGAVDKWIFENILGLRAEATGFKTFIIAPKIGGGLTHAEGRYQSIYGEIKSAWHREGQTVTQTITIPANTRARIRLYLPKAILSADGLDFDEGTALAGSGTYEIKYTLKA